MLRAIAYLRTNDGDREKIAAQRAAIAAWALCAGATVTAWFIDEYESVSTAPLDRSTLRAAIAVACQSGATLIVTRADRLSRSISQIDAIATLLQRHGARLQTIDSP